MTVQQFDELGVSIAARLQEANKAKNEAITALETTEKARKIATEAVKAAEKAKQEAEVARDTALVAARKEAEQVLAEARRIELAAHASMAEAQLRGVTAAYAAILPDRKPVANSVEGIIVEVEAGIQGVRSLALAEVEAKAVAAELRGVTAAFTAILPDQKPVANSVEGIIVEIETGIQRVRRDTEVGAWSKVLTFLGKPEVPAGATPKTLAKEVDKAIASKVADLVAKGLEKVFGFFGREAPVATNPEALDAALVDAGETYKAETRRDGLLLAVSKIQRVELTQVTGMDEAQLTAVINEEADKFRQGVVVQTKDAFLGWAKYIFGVANIDFLRPKADKTVKLRDLLKNEFDRLSLVEKHLEKVLPLLVEHAPEFAEDARKLIDARPQVANVAKKVAMGGNKSGQKSGQDEEPEIS